jgi:hypothetical protein
MPSFATVTNGAVVQAQDVNQMVNALNGAAGLGVPLAVTAVNDSVNFAAAIKNGETTNSRALQVLRANNVVLLQADANGVVGSVDGIAAAAQLVNVSLAQTLTNKTLTNPHFTTGIVDSGGLTITAGGLQITAGNVGLPNAPTADTGLNIQVGTTTLTTQRGIFVQPTVNSSATTEGSAIMAGLTTAASAFTLTTATNFHATGFVKGAGSAITNAFGVLVDAFNVASATENAGIKVSVPSGAPLNLAMDVTGTIRYNSAPGFVSGCKYVCQDINNGNLIISALGPAS